MSAATVSGHRKGRSIEAGVRARKSAARLDSRSGRTSWNRFRRSMAPTLSHQGCSTADQGPGLGPSYLQSGLGGTGIAHHGNSRTNVNNVLARNIYERRQSGLGQYLDVSLFESAVSLAVWEAGGYFGSGAVSRPAGSAHQAQAPYQAIEVRDGYVTIGANTPATWTRFCSA